MGFYDGRLNEKFDRIPNHLVTINFQDEWHSIIEDSQVGVYVFFNGEKANTDTVLFSGHLKSKDVLKGRIDTKYVVDDKSGILVSVTKEILESKLQNYINYIEGEGGFCDDLSNIEKLAKVGKINFSKEIEKIKKDNYNKTIEYYSSPEFLEKLSNTSMTELRYLLGNENFMEWYGEFFELFPKLTLPEGDYKEKLNGVFQFVLDYYMEEIEGAKQEIVDFEKEKKAEIGYLESKENFMSSLILKLNMK